MSEKRVVFHIGARKAGSTYLQKRLRANEAALRRQNAVYPELPMVKGLAGNAKIIPMMFNGKPQTVFKRFFPDIAVASIDHAALMDELVLEPLKTADTVILSGENFDARHAAPLRALIPEDIKCTIVLVARRQDRWLQSYYTHLVKLHLVGASLADFFDNGLTSPELNTLWPDWNEIYTAWSRCFEDCNVIIYDEVKDRLFDAFLDAADLDRADDYVAIEKKNTRLSLFELTYLQSLDNDIERKVFNSHKSAAARAAARSPALDRYDIISPPIRLKLREFFGDSNERLLTCIGRSDLSDMFEIPKTGPAFFDLDDFSKSQQYLNFFDQVGNISEKMGSGAVNSGG